MTQSTQQITTSFTPPPAAAVSPTADATNAKVKLAAYLLPPAGGAPAVSTVNLLRSITGKGLFASLVGATTLPMSLVTATVSNLTYRQLPTYLLGRNLVQNGGFQAGSAGWTAINPATVVGSVVADALSPSGYSMRYVASAGGDGHAEIILVEAGKVYSIAAQGRADGLVSLSLYIQWLDANGQLISQPSYPSVSSTTMAEFAQANYTAPGNARSMRLATYLSGTGIAYISCIRLMQQSTAPAAWVPAHQVYFNQGACVYEAATNLLPNAGFTISGQAAAHSDPLADYTAFTTIAGAPSVAGNVLTVPAGAEAAFGPVPNEWWDLPDTGTVTTLSRIPIRHATGLTSTWKFTYTDANNWIALIVDGTNLSLQKMVAGVQTNVSGNVACALTNATDYWLLVKRVGSAVTVYVYSDNAGAVNTQVATATGTIADAGVAYGRMSLAATGASLTVGKTNGVNARSISILCPGLTGWYIGATAGVPSFFVSKQQHFASTYVPGIYNNAVAANGFWSQTSASLTQALAYSDSVRIKTSGAGASGDCNVGGYLQTTASSGTADWSVKTASVASWVPASGAQSINLRNTAGPGTAYFDYPWLAQQAYDTGNSDPTGQSYNTGARPAGSITEPLPSGFDWTKGFAIAGTYRPDHAFSGVSHDRYLFELLVDANNRMYAVVDASGGGNAIRFMKNRQNVSSQANDGAATLLAAADVVSWGVLFIPGTGMYLILSKNGAAQTTYNQPSAETQLATFAAGTPTLYLGRSGTGTGFEMDGSVGIDRIWTTVDSTTLAKLQGVVGGTIYGDPTDNDAAVWNFNGQVYQVPVVDDNIPLAGASADYRADTSSAGANAATQQGTISSITYTPSADGWWLKDIQAPANNVKLPVLNEFPYKVHRPALVVSPIAPSSQAETVIYGPSTYGVRATLKFRFSSVADQAAKVTALRTILGSNDDIYLLDPFNGTRKVKLPAGIEVALHEYLTDGSLSVIEVI